MKCNVIIPCAGHAKRFVDAGFLVPKPLIRLRGQYMFERSVESIDQDHIRLHFIVLKKHVDKFNIDGIIKDIYEDAEVHILDDVLNGCVATVMSIKDEIDNPDPLLIQNVDVAYAPTFNWIEHYDPREIGTNGLVLTTESDHPKHSYVRINDNGVVIEVAEKKVISSHAVVGTYFFKEGSYFVQAAAEMMKDAKNRVNNEWYVTPLLGYLQGDVRTLDVRQFYPLGTPYDIYEFIESKEGEV